MSILSTSRRAIARVSIVTTLAIVAAACGGAGGAAATPPRASAPGSPAPSVPRFDTTEALLVDPSARDGQVVSVHAFLLAADGKAHLCSVVLESYPPQCGGGTVRMTGQVPADVLDRLDTTSEVGADKPTWGWVVATGTFRATGLEGVPTLELTEIVIAEG
jgi:hypothetical protein